MASVEDLKAQLMAACEILTEAAGKAAGIADDLEKAEQLVQATFEGSGNADVLGILGRMTEMAITVSDVQIEALSIRTNVEDAVARM
jgi:hypothetical protein